jgi:hypothetical protein
MTTLVIAAWLLLSFIHNERDYYDHYGESGS